MGRCIPEIKIKCFLHNSFKVFCHMIITFKYCRMGQPSPVMVSFSLKFGHGLGV